MTLLYIGDNHSTTMEYNYNLVAGITLLISSMVVMTLDQVYNRVKGCFILMYTQ